MKKVLLITPYFPPQDNIGGVRARGLAKYLPEFGYEPVILTVALPSAPEARFRVVQTEYPGDVYDVLAKRLGISPTRGMRDRVGDALATANRKNVVIRWLVWFAKSIITYPDHFKTWYPYALKAGAGILEKGKMDAVISSTPPMTPHFVAKELKRRYGIPWVADLRDLWTQDHYVYYPPLIKFFSRKLEIKTLSEADAIVTVSDPLSRELGSLHKGKKIYTITNGFDPDEVAPARLTEEFTVTYTGRFIDGRRDPSVFLKVLNELIDEGSIDAERVNVRFYGPRREWLDRVIKACNLEGVVVQNGPCSREEVLRRQRESQLLLLLGWDDPRDAGVYTGKIFEYLAARRPVMVVNSPEGVLSSLMEKTDAGVFVRDRSHLKEVLLGYYNEYKGSGAVKYHGKEEEISVFSHRKMAERFARVMDELASKRVSLSKHR